MTIQQAQQTTEKARRQTGRRQTSRQQTKDATKQQTFPPLKTDSKENKIEGNIGRGEGNIRLV
jgi:hypothetical protein